MKRKPLRNTPKSCIARLNTTDRLIVSSDDHRLLALTAFAAAIFTFLAYLPSLRNGFLDWDDLQYVVQNANIRSLNWEFFRWALVDYRINLWHPLTWISHAIDYAVWGLQPFGHHLSNNLLHAINTGIVAWLAQLLMRTESRTRPEASTVDTRFLLLASGITAILFGLHPIHVESVAWVAERKDLLYSFFYMASTIAYLHFAQTETSGTLRPWYWHKYYWLSLGLFSLSLASKPMAVTLPIVLMILDWYPLRRIGKAQSLVTLLYEKIPFYTLSTACSIITLFAQKSVGGLKPLEHATIAIRISVAFRSLVQYLWNLIAPVKLLPFYHYPKNAALTKPAYMAAAAMVILITVLCVRVRRDQKIWLSVWGYFLVTVMPVLGIFQAGWQAMADRFMYLPSLGLFLLAGIGYAKLWMKVEASAHLKTTWKAGAAFFMLAVAVAMLLLTLKQTAIWKDGVSLWDYNLRNTGEIYPEAYFLRGSAYRDVKQYGLAIDDYTKAITLDPTYALAYVERAAVLLETRQFERAIEDAGRGLTINPNLDYGHVIRGTAFLVTGDTTRAEAEYDAAIAKKPNSASAYIGRAFLRKNMGAPRKAIEDYTMALALNPGNTDIYLVRGDLYQAIGSKDLAIADFQKACQLGNKSACLKAIMPLQIGP